MRRIPILDWLFPTAPCAVLPVVPIPDSAAWRRDTNERFLSPLPCCGRALRQVPNLQRCSDALIQPRPMKPRRAFVRGASAEQSLCPSTVIRPTALTFQGLSLLVPTVLLESLA